MKKLIAIIVCAAVLLGLPGIAAVSAAVSDWTLPDGWQNKTPLTLTETSDGYEFSGETDCVAFSKTPADVNSISAEIRYDAIPGYNEAAIGGKPKADTGLGLSVLAEPKEAHYGTKSDWSGLVVFLMPQTQEKLSVQVVINKAGSWNVAAMQNISAKVSDGDTFKISVKKNGAGWDISVNGIAITGDYSALSASMYANSKGYLGFYSFSQNAIYNARWTLTALNGQSLANKNAPKPTGNTGAASKSNTAGTESGTTSAPSAPADNTPAVKPSDIQTGDWILPASGVTGVPLDLNGTDTGFVFSGDSAGETFCKKRVDLGAVTAVIQYDLIPGYKEGEIAGKPKADGGLGFTITRKPVDASYTTRAKWSGVIIYLCPVNKNKLNVEVAINTAGAWNVVAQTPVATGVADGDKFTVSFRKKGSAIQLSVNGTAISADLSSLARLLEGDKGYIGFTTFTRNASYPTKWTFESLNGTVLKSSGKGDPNQKFTPSAAGGSTGNTDTGSKSTKVKKAVNLSRFGTLQYVLIGLFIVLFAAGVLLILFRKGGEKQI